MQPGKILFAAALAALVDVAAAQSADGFVPLFDGSLDGWTVENSTLGNFKVEDGVLRVEGTEGWLRSERQYADFELRIELRFLTADGDSGIFVRAVPDGTFARGWPAGSYQVQLLSPFVESRFPPIGEVFRHGMPPGESTFDRTVSRRAFRGVGEWQTLEIDAAGEELAIRLNGVLLSRATNIANLSGYLGIQGETDALEIRKIEIRERSATPD